MNGAKSQFVKPRAKFQIIANELKFLARSTCVIILTTLLFAIIYGLANYPTQISDTEQREFNDNLKAESCARFNRILEEFIKIKNIKLSYTSSEPLIRDAERLAYILDHYNAEFAQYQLKKSSAVESIGSQYSKYLGTSKYDKFIHTDDALENINDFRCAHWKNDVRRTSLILLLIMLGFVSVGRYIFHGIRSVVRWINCNETN